MNKIKLYYIIVNIYFFFFLFNVKEFFYFSENISTTQPSIDVNLVEENENHHQHEVGSKWSPLFEDGPGPVNVTARIGSTVQLDCKIQLLHDKTVRQLDIMLLSLV